MTYHVPYRHSALQPLTPSASSYKTKFILNGVLEKLSWPNWTSLVGKQTICWQFWFPILGLGPAEFQGEEGEPLSRPHCAPISIVHFLGVVPTLRLSGWDADLLRHVNFSCLDLLFKKNSPKTSHSTQLLQQFFGLLQFGGKLAASAWARVERTGVNISSLGGKWRNQARINL